MEATLDLAAVVVLAILDQDKVGSQANYCLDIHPVYRSDDLDNRLVHQVNCYQDKVDLDVPKVENSLDQLGHLDHHHQEVDRQYRQ
jgi:predicted RNase H-related nuclease YkuK (DUF458 family)